MTGRWDTSALHAAMPFTALLGATVAEAAPAEVRLRLSGAPIAARRAACSMAAR